MFGRTYNATSRQMWCVFTAVEVLFTEFVIPLLWSLCYYLCYLLLVLLRTASSFVLCCSLHQTKYDVIDLHPATWYVIRVTAHNDAGSTECLLRFATKAYDGSGLLPPPDVAEVHFSGDGRIARGGLSRPFYERAEIIVPLCACAVASFVTVVAVIICWRRRVAIMRMKTRQAMAFKIVQVSAWRDSTVTSSRMSTGKI